jgi:hypothetical protein
MLALTNHNINNARTNGKKVLNADKDKNSNKLLQIKNETFIEENFVSFDYGQYNSPLNY